MPSLFGKQLAAALRSSAVSLSVVFSIALQAMHGSTLWNRITQVTRVYICGWSLLLRYCISDNCALDLSDMSLRWQTPSSPVQNLNTPESGSSSPQEAVTKKGRSNGSTRSVPTCQSTIYIRTSFSTNVDAVPVCIASR